MSAVQFVTKMAINKWHKFKKIALFTEISRRSMKTAAKIAQHYLLTVKV